MSTDSTISIVALDKQYKIQNTCLQYVCYCVNVLFVVDKFPEISTKAPFENFDWDEVVDEGGSTIIHVLALEEQSRQENLKRKRKCSKYKCSPFNDPTRKRAKGQNLNPNPTFVDIHDDKWVGLKKWIEEDDSLEPTIVVLDIPGFNEVNHKFFRELIEPDEWLWTQHIDTIGSLLKKFMANKKIEITSPYFTHKIPKKDINIVEHWAGDRLLPLVNWSSF